ncbi:hypothetical protein HDU86_007633 [Geranomyces michiganensis]|nr:hypothetical protein HDU86_007633 [Geranomyces michiganensis]
MVFSGPIDGNFETATPIVQRQCPKDKEIQFRIKMDKLNPLAALLDQGPPERRLEIYRVTSPLLLTADLEEPMNFRNQRPAIESLTMLSYAELSIPESSSPFKSWVVSYKPDEPILGHWVDKSSYGYLLSFPLAGSTKSAGAKSDGTINCAYSQHNPQNFK